MYYISFTTYVNTHYILPRPPFQQQLNMSFVTFVELFDIVRGKKSNEVQWSECSA